MRIKDIDLGMSQIVIRNSKGHKDRATMLPDNAKSQLESQLKYVKFLHEKDLNSLLFRILSDSKIDGIYNLAPDTYVTVRDLEPKKNTFIFHLVF